MNTFVEQRLNTKQMSFWEPIPKLKVKTYPVLPGTPRWQLKKEAKSALAALIEANLNVCARLQPFPRNTIHLTDSMALGQVLKSAGR